MGLQRKYEDNLYNNLREIFGACLWPGPALGGSDSSVRGREPAAACPPGEEARGEAHVEEGGEWGKRGGGRALQGQYIQNTQRNVLDRGTSVSKSIMGAASPGKRKQPVGLQFGVQGQT